MSAEKEVAKIAKEVVEILDGMIPTIASKTNVAKLELAIGQLNKLT